jgi:hypothetical protein
MEMGECPHKTTRGNAGGYLRIFVNVDIVVEVNKSVIPRLSKDRKDQYGQKHANEEHFCIPSGRFGFEIIH